MPTITGSDWLVADVRVDAIRADVPERTRGETIPLDCLIIGQGAAGATTTVLGGDDGTTWGDSDGGTLSTTTEDRAYRRYRRLRQYTEFAGEGSSYQLIGGLPAVHENPQDEWEVDSHIITVQPGPDVQSLPAFWGLVVGAEDESSSSAIQRFELDLELVFLADRTEFDTREDLLDGLSPVSVQYPE